MSAAPSHTRSHLSLVKVNAWFHVRSNKKLPHGARMMYRDIADLVKSKDYCNAGDEWFAKAYGVPVRTIRFWMTKLDRCGYIDRDGRGTARSIQLSSRWHNLAPQEVENPPSDGGKEPTTPLRKVDENTPPVAESSEENRQLVAGSNRQQVAYSDDETATGCQTNRQLVAGDYRYTITESVESRAHVGAPAREAPTDNDNNNSSSTDLSFLPAKDLERYEEAIRETLSLIPSDQQQPEVLKARTWGRGMGMNPAEWRAMNRTIKELGWIKTVAACTIASSLNVPLAKIDSVTSQWQKSYHEHEWAPNANAVYEDWEL